jgi:hypothetical protein
MTKSKDDLSTSERDHVAEERVNTARDEQVKRDEQAAREAADAKSLAQANQPTKKEVPGATAFVAKPPTPDAKQYEVVDQPYFDGGKLHEIGSKVWVSGTNKDGLPSPGRYLKPVGFKGRWPPLSFAEAQARKDKEARKVWAQDLLRG